MERKDDLGQTDLQTSTKFKSGLGKPILRLLQPKQGRQGKEIHWLKQAIIGSVVGFIVGTFIQGLVPWFPWVPNIDPEIKNYVVEPSYWEGETKCIRRCQKVFIDVETKDLNNDCLEYIWNIHPASLPEGRTRDKRVTYTAPNVSCEVYVQVTVYDGRGGMAELQDIIRVE